MSSQGEAKTWHELLGQILEDPQEKQRIAKEVRVHPMTLVRWVNKDARPRYDNMHLLFKAIRHEYASSFAQLIKEDFPDLVVEDTASVSISQELPSEFYARVLSAYANTVEILYRKVIYDLVLQQMLEHLDPQRLGMLVSIVCCVRPRHGMKVRSLREIEGMGTPPWSRNQEQKTIFLGAESLAGAAVMRGRAVVVQSREESYMSMPIHWEEHEQSALAHPLMHKMRVAGCLLVTSTQPYYFSETHIALIERYAHLMALAFDAHQFFEVRDIDLRPMPSYAEQAVYFQHFNRRVVRKFAEVGSGTITFEQAQEMVWEEIEDQLLQLTPYLGE